MHFKGVLFLVFAVLILCACSDYDLNGDAYIVKGAGDVKPVAGQKVFLLPYESEIDFFYEASTQAYDIALGEVAGELESLCKDATKIAGKKIEDLKKVSEEIKNKKTVPRGGCSSIHESVNGLSKKIENVKKDYDNQLAMLNGDLKKLEDRKKAKVQKGAEKIEGKIKGKINIKLITQGIDRVDPMHRGYEYTYIVENKTDYCVAINRVDVMCNDYVIKKDTFFYSNIEDKYGFDTECDVLPHSSRKYDDKNIISDAIDSPEEKMMLADRKLIRFGKSNYPKINKLVIDYKLTRMSSEKKGSKVNYHHSDISYYELALKNNKYPEIDKEISELKSRKNNLTQKFKSNQDVKDFLVLESKLEECKKDEELISSYDKKIKELDGIIANTSSFVKEVGSMSMAVSSIDTLNKNYSANIKMPEFYEEYIKKSLGLLAKKIGESLQVQTTIKGAYDFKKVKKGKYLLFAEYNDNFNSGFWIKPLDMNDDMRVDLTNNEMIFTPFIEYMKIRIKLWRSCGGYSKEDFIKWVKHYEELDEKIKILEDKLKGL